MIDVFVYYLFSHANLVFTPGVTRSFHLESSDSKSLPSIHVISRLLTDSFCRGVNGERKHQRLFFNYLSKSGVSEEKYATTDGIKTKSLSSKK